MPEDLRENELIKQKKAKLGNIIRDGVYPYGGKFETTSTIKALQSNFVEGRHAALAGRIMAARSHGKSSFYDIKDSTAKIQVYFKEDTVGAEPFKFLNNIDIGDFIGVKGETFKTRTGEPTIVVREFKILAKSLRPLPEKWHGLKDVETRYRQRYIDLIVNDEVRNVFIARSKIVTEIRRFLDDKGFIEVETPMMQAIPGGAAGKPFKTHHEALGIDLYLRIAPELYLKRLLVGGLDKVYEINRNFRNEGISIRHNPEFTMLEVYEAYSDCGGMMKLTEELVTSLAKNVIGKTILEYQGKTIDLSRWEKISFADLMKEQFDITPADKQEEWVKKLKKKGIEIDGDDVSRTQLINIVGELVEPKCGNHPVFVVDIFKEMCPLAKTKPDNPMLTDRFELYMGGMEIANAYSELNDPIEQRARFEEELKDTKTKNRKPKTENRTIDEDFVTALEYGMPPAGGLGIGIDRLVMILTNSASIRDVILFPQLKPEKAAKD
ncbi:MAG: lysine--tRNA ligase [Candidatus Omnitrophica bacterium]|nr:lysine--tRNA ligase [Candidatus Omnitrophota bacterium]